MISKPTTMLRRFSAGTSGQIALVFGLAAPLLLGVAGIAVDYATWINQRATLQKAADAAALAAASELRMGKVNKSRIQSVAQTVVASIVQPDPNGHQVAVKAAALKGDDDDDDDDDHRDRGDKRKQGVRVVLSQRKAAIMSAIMAPQLTAMEVAATAVLVGAAQLCVVGLDESAPDTVRLDDNAKIAASGCSVYVNSTNSAAIRSEDNATVTSLLTCSAGGYKGGSKNFQPKAPRTDCPKVPDPLAKRPAPEVGPCKYNNHVVKVSLLPQTLDPGTYCGGLMIESGATVTLRPGVYVIKDGPLHIGPPVLSVAVGGLLKVSLLPGVMKGDNVGFYFTGTVPPDKDGRTTVMRFMKESIVELTAPTTGPMAGLLFHENRTSPIGRRFDVISDEARRLVGTIYIPRGIFSVSANQNVADRSEYTAIVTRRLELSQAPKLVLNNRYSDTDVPVPEGLGPTSGQTRLVE
jgi:Putative Flp pilus-assembly TadE/G-like